MRAYVLAGLLLLCAGSGEAAAENYGAIAYSPSTKAYGWSYDYPSRGAAEREALSGCRAKASDCIIPLWFRNCLRRTRHRAKRIWDGMGNGTQQRRAPGVGRMPA